MNDSTHSSCNTLVKNTKMEFFKYIAKLKHKNEQNKINNTNPKQNQLPPQSYRFSQSRKVKLQNSLHHEMSLCFAKNHHTEVRKKIEIC